MEELTPAQIEALVNKLLDDVAFGDDESAKKALKRLDSFVHGFHVRDHMSKLKKEERINFLTSTLGRYEKVAPQKRKASYIASIGKVFHILGWKCDKEFSDFVIRHVQDDTPMIRNAVVLMVNSTSLYMLMRSGKTKFSDNIIQFFRELKKLTEKYQLEYSGEYSIDKMKPSVLKSLYLIYESVNHRKYMEELFDENKELRVSIPRREYEDWTEEDIDKDRELVKQLPETLWKKYPQKLESEKLFKELYVASLAQLKECLYLFGFSDKSVSKIMDTAINGGVAKEKYTPVLSACMKSDFLEYTEDKNNYSFMAILRNFSFVTKNIVHKNSKEESYSNLVIDILSSRIWYGKQHPKDVNMLVRQLNDSHKKVEEIKVGLIHMAKERKEHLVEIARRSKVQNVMEEELKEELKNDYRNISACTLAAHNALDWYLEEEPNHSILKTPDQIAFVAWSIVYEINEQFDQIGLPFDIKEIQDYLVNIGKGNFLSRFAREIVFDEMKNPKIYLFDFTEEDIPESIPNSINWNDGYVESKKKLNVLVKKLKANVDIDKILLSMYLDEPGSKVFSLIDEFMPYVTGQEIFKEVMGVINECWNNMPRRYAFNKSPNELVREFSNSIDQVDEIDMKNMPSPYF